MQQQPISPQPPTSCDGGDSAPPPPAGLCLGCNYPLRGLSEPRCPECGRAFDPRDPGTMNMGRPIGRIGQLLARPIGWSILLLALAATAGVLYQSRWPVGGLRALHFSRIDLTYYRAYARLPWKPQPGTLRDQVYTYALTLEMIVAAVWVLRTLLRWSAVRLYRIPAAQRIRQGRRQAAMVLLLGLTLAAAGFGWPYRIARLWSEAPPATPAMFNGSAIGGPFRPLRLPPVPCPLPLDEAEETAVLRAGVVQLGSPALRRGALDRLIRNQPAKAGDALVLAVPREKDTSLRALELCLLGLCRNNPPDDRVEETLAAFLNDPSPGVRAAAADGLGVHYGPAYPVTPVGETWNVPDAVTTDGNLPIAPLLQVYPSTSPPPAAAGLSPQARAALEKMMLRGATREEREAAARALLPWPPAGYQLRLAEWGVWVTGANGLPGSPGVGLVGRQLDGIPPFVHQTANSSKDFTDRIVQPAWVFKPVIHLTVSQPLAVDLEVILQDGRPWFAYPRPDDFALALGGLSSDPWQATQQPLAALDAAGTARRFAPLTDLREGYPWLTPAHRMHATSGRTAFPGIGSLGLRWQSLIVSPGKLDWMAPPQVGSGPGNEKYRWWERLREIPSAWVSSRGEAERFVYYDGPTRLYSPVAVRAEGKPPVALHFLPDPVWAWRDQVGSTTGPATRTAPPSWRFVEQGATGLEGGGDRWGAVGAAEWTSARDVARPRTRGPGGNPGRQGLFVRVTGSHVEGRAVTVPPTQWREGKGAPEERSVQLDSADPIQGPAVEVRLRAMLTDAGLTAAEADGLLAAWREPFFETQGTRFLLLLSPADYDTMCPLTVRPPPTQVARVGIVLTEF